MANAAFNNEQFNDCGDAAGPGRNANNIGHIAQMPVERRAGQYNMRHRRRGLALIFNNENFNQEGLKKRSGTNVDADNLKAALENHKFDVRIFPDYTFDEIDETTTQAAKANHQDADCILIAILSHGEMGIIYARDVHYKLETIWKKFTSDKCPTLAGKPKLFFIQACQGDQLDAGSTLISKTQTESKTMLELSYRIPTHADFLIAYSTIPGYYSWRNTTKGSWFMQALCQELNENGAKYDILTLLTYVIQHVAIDFESNTPDYAHMHQQKQIPCITTQLTRQLFLTPK